MRMHEAVLPNGIIARFLKNKIYNIYQITNADQSWILKKISMVTVVSFMLSAHAKYQLDFMSTVIVGKWFVNGINNGREPTKYVESKSETQYAIQNFQSWYRSCYKCWLVDVVAMIKSPVLCVAENSMKLAWIISTRVTNTPVSSGTMKDLAWVPVPVGSYCTARRHHPVVEW